MLFGSSVWIIEAAPGPGGIDQDVVDQCVLIDLGPAAVGGNAMAHDVADLVAQIAGHRITFAGLSSDIGDAKGGRCAKLRLLSSARRRLEYSSGLPHRRDRLPESKSHWPRTICSQLRR